MRVRTRLLTAALLTLTVGLGALLVTGNVLLAAGVDSDASRMLRDRAQAQIAALRVTSSGIVVNESPNDRSLDRGAWIFDGARLVEHPTRTSPGADRLAQRLGRARGVTERTGPDGVRLRAQPVFRPGTSRRAGAVVVAVSLGPLERLQREVLLGSIAVAVVVLLAAWLAIRSALDGALRPVAEMTRRAEDWSEHDLDGRFGLGPPRDELTGLAAVLDNLLARIAASRRHEQRFAGDAAHELRTPLARLRARSELALDAHGAGADAARREALEHVVDQVDDISASIDVLLAMARAELADHPGAADLRELAAEHPEVEVDGPDELPRAEGEPEVVRRALAPLVENALRHARQRVWIELRVSGRFVEAAVRDDGPGLDPALGDRVFEPGIRGGNQGSGAGLGLPLARRVARTCGGDVLAEPGPGGCFVLRLPAVQEIAR